MESEVLSSRSNSPDIYFNNFLDEEESDDSEECVLPETEEVSDGYQKEELGNCFNNARQDTVLEQGPRSHSQLEGDEKRYNEATDIAKNSKVTIFSSLSNNFEGDYHTEQEDARNAMKHEDFSSHSSGMPSVSSFHLPYGKESYSSMGLDIYSDADSEDGTINPCSKDLKCEEIKEVKTDNSNIRLPSRFEVTRNDILSGAESTPEVKNLKDDELPAVGECTCAMNGVKFVSEMDVDDSDENDTENMNIPATAATGNAALLQDYMVGLVPGDAEDMIGGPSVAKRKTDRLETRFPRIYHTRKYSKKEKSRLSAKGLMSHGSELYRPQTPMTILSKFAKEKGTDLSYVMEHAEELGLNAQFPCMQCFDQLGKSSLMEKMYSYEYPMKQGAGTNRCSRCGAEKMNLVTFGKMLLKLKQTFRDMGLTVRDVSSDGNCLFAAIVDQLRVRGDFRYTQENLRLAAVEYLRNHPKADDGTPYAMFLSDETWDEYLTKMSKDGEWGDHMVLSAVSNVLGKKVIIFGGRTGEGQTQIIPKCCSEIEEDRNNEATENRNHEINKEHSGRDEIENRECMENETKNNNKEEIKERKRAGTKEGTEAEAKKAGKEKEKQPPKYDESCLYLGHIGESHYVSLRRKDWRTRLLQGLQAQLLKRKNQTILREYKPKDVSTDYSNKDLNDISLQPLDHLNLIIRQLLEGGYIGSVNATFIDTFDSCLKTEKFTANFIGDDINKLTPYVVPIKSMLTSGSKLFANEQDCISKPNKEEGKLDAALFVTTLDTEVIQSDSNGRKFDLVMEKVCEQHDLVRLEPVHPPVWKGRTCSLESDKVYLNSFPIHFPVPQPSITGDVRLAFHSPWPAKAHEWRVRKRISGWPDAMTVATVIDEGVNIIPVDLGEKHSEVLDEPSFVESIRKEDHSLWLLSFAATEKEILRFLPDNAKYCFLLFKLLLQLVFKGSDGVPDSCLKHVFFYACEKIQKEEWKKTPGNCLLYMLQKLRWCLMTTLPHYFYPSKNLIQSIDKRTLDICIERLDILCQQPLLGIFLLMDEHDLDISELGQLLDDLIEDVNRFNKHGNISRSVEESFVPGLYCMLQDYVLQSDYENAMKTVKTLEELLSADDNDDVIVNIILSALRTQHIGYPWCLALYIELISKKQHLTKKVLENYETVPITEIFGPEIGSELGDTVAPEVCSIPRMNVTFTTAVVSVLEASGNTTLLTKCLRYYIETCHNIFGFGPFPCASGRLSGVCSCGLTKLLYLHTLYTRLFYGYSLTGHAKEFKDLIPNLITLTDMMCSPKLYQSTIRILTEMGETDEATEVRKKMNTMEKYSYEAFY